MNDWATHKKTGGWASEQETEHKEPARQWMFPPSPLSPFLNPHPHSLGSKGDNRPCATTSDPPDEKKKKSDYQRKRRVSLELLTSVKWLAELQTSSARPSSMPQTSQPAPDFSIKFTWRPPARQPARRSIIISQTATGGRWAGGAQCPRWHSVRECFKRRLTFLWT